MESLVLERAGEEEEEEVMMVGVDLQPRQSHLRDKHNVTSSEMGTESTNGFPVIENLAYELLKGGNVGDDEVVSVKKEDTVSISKSITHSAIGRGLLGEIFKDSGSSSSLNSFPLTETSKVERNITLTVVDEEEVQHEHNGEEDQVQHVAIVEEFDVVRVLEKQETHDLICPNCNSCITKRVILRRKRKIQLLEVPSENIPPEGADTGPDCEVPSENILPEGEGGDTGPDLFRCLSCFSIFAPPNRLAGASASADLLGEDSNRPAGASAFLRCWNGLKSLLLRSPAPVAPTEDPTDGAIEQDPGKVGVIIDIPGRPVHPGALETPDEKPQSPASVAPTEDTTDGAIEQDPGKVGVIIDIPGKPVHPGALETPDEKPQSLAPVAPTEDTMDGAIEQDPGKADVIIKIPGRPVQPGAPETSPESDAQPGTAILPAPPEDPQAGAFSGLDVLRAIVYGGLVESITSLSVVTSAVSAGAATLNILILGVANLLGGLFILAHHLRVLRYETVARYEETLGRSGHFVFHATVAVISYLIFGVLPPVIYCFSFRESNNRDLKLATLASSSLLCIILLSFMKAYARSPPKQYIKTVTYYLGLGISVCGGSYIFGDLLKLLIDKLGWFDSSGAGYSLVMAAVPGRPATAAWTSS
ncbi:hypothetical protein Dimus_000051 [Dionaea muscipula]